MEDLKLEIEVLFVEFGNMLRKAISGSSRNAEGALTSCISRSPISLGADFAMLLMPLFLRCAPSLVPELAPLNGELSDSLASVPLLISRLLLDRDVWALFSLIIS